MNIAEAAYVRRSSQRVTSEELVEATRWARSVGLAHACWIASDLMQQVCSWSMGSTQDHTEQRASAAMWMLGTIRRSLEQLEQAMTSDMVVSMYGKTREQMVELKVTFQDDGERREMIVQRA